MKQLVVDLPAATGEKLRIAGRQFHHLRHVRRMAVGDSLRVVDARGATYDAGIVEVASDFLTLQIGKQRQSAPVGVRVALYAAALKGGNLDSVVRQSVEVGAAEIVPVITERTVIPAAAVRSRLGRWRRIAAEAAEQSGSAPVVVREPLGLQDIPKDFSAQEGELGLVFHEDKELAQGSIHGYLDPTPRGVRVVVGPEGGLSPEETRFLVEAGFVAVRLPLNTLRAETAAIVALATVLTIAGEWNKWKKIES